MNDEEYQPKKGDLVCLKDNYFIRKNPKTKGWSGPMKVEYASEFTVQVVHPTNGPNTFLLKWILPYEGYK